MFEKMNNFLVNFKFDQCEDDGTIVLYAYAKNDSGYMKEDQIFAQRLHEFRSWSSEKKAEAIQQSVQKNVKARFLSCRIIFDNSDDAYGIKAFTNGKNLVVRFVKERRHPCNPPTCAPNQYCTYRYYTFNTQIPDVH